MLSVAMLFLIAGVILFALPHKLEGSVLVRISPGRGVAVADLIALGPLLTGSALLVFRRPLGALRAVGPHRLGGIATPFAAGAGLGLLIASMLRRFVWWWALGVVLLTVALALTSIPPHDGSPR